jgi:hypothetical protein
MDKEPNEERVAALIAELKSLGVSVDLPKVNLSVQIPRELKARMMKRSARMNRSLSDVVRMACQEWMDKSEVSYID